MDRSRICDILSKYAKSAGEILSQIGVKHIERKSKNDYVTENDKYIQNYLIQSLSNEFPESFFIAEEKENMALPDSMGFIIDPIDGTLNYINGFPFYAISIACVYRKKIECAVVYNPVLDELFTAIKGQGAFLNGKRICPRDKSFEQSLVFIDDGWDGNAKVIKEYVVGYRCISCAELAICYVACGKAVGYISQRINIWDYAAGMLIIEESGARIMDSNGKSICLESTNQVRVAAPGFEKVLMQICRDGEEMGKNR